MELAIDTSTETAGIAILSERGIVTELTWHVGQNHTSELSPYLGFLLHQAKLTLKDIGGITVAIGPGSFNGLRSGMSVAKGLAFSLNIPLVGISTLEAEAFPYAATAMPVCPILNAGRGEIATALFQLRRGKWSRLGEEHISTADSLINAIKHKTIFCGNIPDSVSAILKKELKSNALLVEGTGIIRRAGYLAELGHRRLKDSDFDNIATLQPLYLRRPAITISPRWQQQEHTIQPQV
jgi:tRNA threonylcarbamoyl adenosine modification protein YeaZ